MRCICGANAPDGSAFCANCGRALTKTTPTTASRPDPFSAVGDLEMDNFGIKRPDTVAHVPPDENAGGTGGFCGGCGAKLPAGAMYCGACGARQPDPPKPRQSGNRWAILAAVCCAAMVLCAVLVLKPWEMLTGQVGMENLQQVDTVIEQVERKHLSSDGNLAEENVSALLEDVYKTVNQSGLASYCERNTCGVYMVLKDGTGVHYAAPVEELASAGDDLAVYSFQPFFTEFQDKEYGIENPLMCARYPNKGLEALCEMSITASRPQALYDSEVTLEQVKNMRGNGVIVWVGHGGYSTENHSTLTLSVAYDETVCRKYREDILAHRIEVYIRGGKYRVCLTPAFFDYYLPDHALDNSIIYLGSCYSGTDSVLVNTLLDKGADAVYYNTDAMRQVYNNRMCRSVLEGLSSGSSAAQALSSAKKANGSCDNIIFGLLSWDGIVQCAGDTNVTLQTLYREISAQEPDTGGKPKPDSTSHPESLCGVWAYYEPGLQWFIRLSDDGEAYIVDGTFHEGGNTYTGTWSATSAGDGYAISLLLTQGFEVNGTAQFPLELTVHAQLHEGGMQLSMLSGEPIELAWGEWYIKEKLEWPNVQNRYLEEYFCGTWELSGLQFVKDCYVESGGTPPQLTISGNRLTYTLPDGSEYSTTFRAETYLPCINLGDAALYLINHDMMILMYRHEENENGPTITLDDYGEVVFDADVWEEGVWMRQGSETDELPYGLTLQNLSTEYMQVTEAIYYPGAGVIHMYGDGYGAYYVYEDGRLEYIERLAPIGADNMPSDAIYTGYGFAITDNK